ncbi:hypothetical protein K9M78_08140 [Candidatus Bipolaricaulota bacterium]|nr:hypothetical protein [Candidatus Bipolaricaulota bacterium]
MRLEQEQARPKFNLRVTGSKNGIIDRFVYPDVISAYRIFFVLLFVFKQEFVPV